eukprot:8856723-Alexandrium_andersonii.AAC.1
MLDERASEVAGAIHPDAHMGCLPLPSSPRRVAVILSRRVSWEKWSNPSGEPGTGASQRLQATRRAKLTFPHCRQAQLPPTPAIGAP